MDDASDDGPVAQPDADAAPIDEITPEDIDEPELEAATEPELQLADVAAAVDEMHQALAADTTPAAPTVDGDDKDAEIARLRARVAELEAEVQDLKAKRAFDAVQPTSGIKLSHATKGRSNPRTARAAASSPSKSKDETDAEDPSVVTAADSEEQPASTSATDAEAPEVSTPTDLKKKIATMGGVSAFGGFNPFAGGVMSPASLKSRSSVTSGSGSLSGFDPAELQAAKEREGELKDWVVATVGGDLADDGRTFKDLLRDGTVLCRLASALKPDAPPVKFKAGKFTFVHKENVANYMAAAESIGVSRSVAFAFEDLSDEEAWPKVLVHLAALKKIITDKA